MPTCKTITWSLALGGCLLWGAPALATDPVPIDGALLTAMTFLNSSTGKQVYWSTTVFPTVNCANCGGAGGGGGVATQGGRDSSVSPWETNIFVGSSPVSTSNVLPTGDFALDALIAGGKFSVTDALLDAALASAAGLTFTPAPGATIAVTGVSAPNDLVQQFSMSTAYSGGAVECPGSGSGCSVSTFRLQGAGSVTLQVNATSSQVFGSMDGTTWTGPLSQYPVMEGNQVQNNQGPVPTTASPGVLMCVPASQFAYVQVRENGSTPVAGTIQANAASCGVQVVNPIETEPPFTSSSWTVQNLALGSTSSGGYITLRPGANRRTRITGVTLHCTATSAGVMDVQVRRSASLSVNGSGGTQTSVTASAGAAGAITNSGALTQGQASTGSGVYTFTGTPPTNAGTLGSATAGGTLTVLGTTQVPCSAVGSIATDVRFLTGYPQTYNENWGVLSGAELELYFISPPAGATVTAQIDESLQSQ